MDLEEVKTEERQMEKVLSTCYYIIRTHFSDYILKNDDQQFFWSVNSQLEREPEPVAPFTRHEAPSNRPVISFLQNR